MDTEGGGDGRQRGERAGAPCLSAEDGHLPDAGPPREFAGGPPQRQTVCLDCVVGVHGPNTAPHPGQTQGVLLARPAPPPGQGFRYGAPTMPKDERTFGERLRELREREGISQRELAKRSGETKSTIDRIENGGQVPGVDKAQALADALGVDIAVLTGRAPPPVDVEAIIREFEAAEEARPMIRPTEPELQWLRSLDLVWRIIPPSVEMMRAFIDGKRRAGI